MTTQEAIDSQGYDEPAKVPVCSTCNGSGRMIGGATDGYGDHMVPCTGCDSRVASKPAKVEAPKLDLAKIAGHIDRVRNHAGEESLWPLRMCGVPALLDDAEALLDEVARLTRERDRLTALLNTPEVDDFAKGVQLEALHQRERWGSDHDGGKTDADWFWLVGHLASKALCAVMGGNAAKAKHHLVTTAATLCNWHAATLGKTNMRPGIMPPQGPA